VVMVLVKSNDLKYVEPD